jgi:hypothetical protein
MRDQEKPEVKVEVEYPSPELTPEKQEELKKHLESTLIHFFPNVPDKWEIILKLMPRYRMPK